VALARCERTICLRFAVDPPPFTLVPLLHLYVGLRLLPDLPLTAFGFALGSSSWSFSGADPLAMLSRRMPDRRRADRLAWAGFVAMGLFSSVLC